MVKARITMADESNGEYIVLGFMMGNILNWDYMGHIIFGL